MRIFVQFVQRQRIFLNFEYIFDDVSNIFERFPFWVDKIRANNTDRDSNPGDLLVISPGTVLFLLPFLHVLSNLYALKLLFLLNPGTQLWDNKLCHTCFLYQSFSWYPLLWL